MQAEYVVRRFAIPAAYVRMVTLLATDPLIVPTSAGLLRGEHHGAARRWRGIPFAAPPVGSLRWRAPQPVEPWRGVRSAVEPGPADPQEPKPATGGIPRWFPQSEDCLYLDVTVPGTSASDSPLPVLVFIHGGAYRQGAGGIPDYDASALAAHGVIVVTISYRLGVFGSMDLRTLGGDGIEFDVNCTLRDQVAALQWVHAEIGEFGGDPARVTIVGESSGGNSITTLLATPSARGLFQGAIAQSPHPQTGHSAAKKAPYAARLANRLGVDPLHAAKAMLAMPADRLWRVANQLDADVVAETPLVALYSPTIDGDILPEHPLEAFRAGRGAPVPLVIGTNRDESSLFVRSRQPIIPNSEGRVRHLVEGTDPAAWQRIRDLYGSGPSRRATKAAWASAGGDGVFRVPSIEVAQAHAAAGNPTWMYRYDHASPLLRAIGLGAAHGTELPYLFGTFRTPLGRIVSGTDDRRTRDWIAAVLQGSWTAFVRDGIPSHEGYVWPRYDEKARNTLAIDRVSHVISDPDANVRRAWTGVVYEY